MPSGKRKKSEQARESTTPEDIVTQLTKQGHLYASLFTAAYIFSRIDELDGGQFELFAIAQLFAIGAGLVLLAVWKICNRKC